MGMKSEKTGEDKRAANDCAVGSDACNEELLKAVAQNADKQAFIKLFEYFAPRLKSFIMRSGVSPDQAEELAQETMLAVWSKAHLYNPAQARASTWIFTIARNKKIDAFRKAGRAELDPNDPMLVGDPAPEPSEAIDRAKEAEIMSRAIKKLSKEQAELIQKSYFEEKTHNAIAEETKLPLGTVKSRIRLALDHLRKNEEIKAIWPQTNT